MAVLPLSPFLKLASADASTELGKRTVAFAEVLKFPTARPKAHTVTVLKAHFTST